MTGPVYFFSRQDAEKLKSEIQSTKSETKSNDQKPKSKTDRSRVLNIWAWVFGFVSGFVLRICGFAPLMSPVAEHIFQGSNAVWRSDLAQ